MSAYRSDSQGAGNGSGNGPLVRRPVPRQPDPHDAILIPDKNVLTVANAFLDAWGYAAMPAGVSENEHDAFRRLWHWNNDFFAFDGQIYRKLQPADFASVVGDFLDTLRVGPSRAKSREIDATPEFVKRAVGKLRLKCQAKGVRSLPGWLRVPTIRLTAPPPPAEVIAFTNGLLFANEFVREPAHGPFTVHCEPTPMWFSEALTPCRFDPHAGCPHWLKFLQQALGDAELIAQLQEWFGYCLTGDTSQQKMLWLIGRPGAGKSTVTKVLKKVIGDDNAVSFRLPDLVKDFTFSAWLDKRLAVSEEAWLGKDRESADIIEQIKAITGEDDRMVDQKFLPILAKVRLSVRLVVAANQFPVLPDASNALRRRSLIIPFECPPAARPDKGLADRLYAEAGGIAWWALQGLRRLRGRGHFELTTASREWQRQYEESNSETLRFSRDVCEVAPDGLGDDELVDEWNTTKSKLYAAYRKWCAVEHIRKPMDLDAFCRDLRAALPQIRDHRPRAKATAAAAVVAAGGAQAEEPPKEKRPRFFKGIRIKAGWEQEFAEDATEEDVPF